ncbi:hypothetical protein JL722_514 [Aureococcus anophagefferens]|nr:hypothetical protein JL722_514 [Aureococcus anophagefferens]
MASFAATEQAAFVLPDAADVLESATPALTSVRVVVTPHRCVKVILHYQAGYPTTAAVVEVRNPAYPPPLLKKILAAAEDAAAPPPPGRGARRRRRRAREELVRRCAAGADVGGEAPKRPVAASAARLGAGDDRGPRVAASGAHFRSLKRDMKALKKIADLRDVGAERTKRGVPAHGREERRGAKRELKTLARFEGARDAAAHAALSATAAEAAAAPPVPSLFAAVEALVDDFAARLPEETCQCCGARVLPEDPAFPAAAGDEPTRALCGHWFHYACLEKRSRRRLRALLRRLRTARGRRGPGPRANRRAP